jgi:hypothetical protein
MMNRVLRQLLPSAMLLACAFGYTGKAHAECPEERSDCHFVVLTEAFETQNTTDGAGAFLGRNVALALQHQIFRNFRINVPINPQNPGELICCLPRDTIASLGSWTIAASENFAPARLALTGQAWDWGDYIVVQPFLEVMSPPTGVDPRVRICCTGTDGIVRTRPFSTDGTWRIWEFSRDGISTIRIDRFPRARYELPQISLDADEVAQFSSLAGLPVYRQKDESTRIPNQSTSHVINALRHEGQWTLIAQPAGWIKLPVVDGGSTVDFIAGIVYFLRGNWERAEMAFERVAGDGGAPTLMRVDANLLRAASLFHRDQGCKACSEPIMEALAFDPYSRVTARFQLMAEMHSATTPSEFRLLLNRVADQPALFSADDPFTQSVRVALTTLAQAN